MDFRSLNNFLESIINRANLFLPTDALASANDRWGSSQVIGHVGRDRVNRVDWLTEHGSTPAIAGDGESGLPGMRC
jgi:hypothetical protein